MPTLDVCNISPSDMAGQINNIMDRLLNCEIAIAKLAGLDVTATNASDMVASLGTITNGTIISSTDAVSASIANWAGTVLPANFSGSVTSNGVTTTWNNGVVSFTVDSSGITVGGGTLKSAVFSNWASGDDTFTGSFAKVIMDTKFYDEIGGLTLSGNEISGFTDGWYYVSAVYITQNSVTTGNLSAYGRIFGSWPEVSDKIEITLDTADGSQWEDSPNLVMSGLAYLYNANPVSFQVFGAVSSGTLTGTLNTLSFIQISLTGAQPP